MSMAWDPQTSLDKLGQRRRSMAIRLGRRQYPRPQVLPMGPPSPEDIDDDRWPEPEAMIEDLKGFGALLFFLTMVGALGMVAR